MNSAQKGPISALNSMKPPKKKGATQILKIPLQLKCHRWLELLVEKAHYGNSKSDVAVVLLGQQFKALVDSGEIPGDAAHSLEEIPFPASKAAPPPPTQTAGKVS